MKNSSRFNLPGAVTAALMLLFTLPGVAQAGVAITAVYQVVAVQPTATGSIVSLDVTVTNSGTEALGSVVLEEVDPTHLAPARNTLTVGNLGVGVQSVSTWNLTTDIPAAQLPSPLHLFLQARAVDGSSNPVAVAVAVEGVAK